MNTKTKLLIYIFVTSALCILSAIAVIVMTHSVLLSLLVVITSILPLVYTHNRIKLVEQQKESTLEKVKESRDSDLYDRVCQIIEKHKCYLKSDYRIEDLSVMANSNKSAISSVINRFSGMNFNQFLNRYRVEFAIELIKNDLSLKMWNVSDLAGFANTNTFNSAFKKHKGKTPTEIREEIVNQRIDDGDTIMRPSLDKMASMS